MIMSDDSANSGLDHFIIIYTPQPSFSISSYIYTQTQNTTVFFRFLTYNASLGHFLEIMNKLNRGDLDKQNHKYYQHGIFL